MEIGNSILQSRRLQKLMASGYHSVFHTHSLQTSFTII